MPFKKTVTNSLDRDALRKIITNPKSTPLQKELAQIRLSYSEDAHLLNNYVNKLVNVGRIYPSHLPTQTSGRWSTLDPPITNWPRACINPTCQAEIFVKSDTRDFAQGNSLSLSNADFGHVEHEWTDACWSVRDILLPDNDEVLITWDHDNIEGKIHDIIVNDSQAIKAHAEGFDLHTITYCNIFNKPYPSNLKNPHTSTEDVQWRRENNWQGKDTRLRVMAKNFNHGSKYTESYKFVHMIPNVESYGYSYKDLEKHAKQYIATKGDAWWRKIDMMKQIRSERIARTLYGFRRVFFDSSAETGREGFSHMISGTVSDYNNETLRLIDEWLGDYVRFLHNAHDGDKIAVKRDMVKIWHTTEEFNNKLHSIIERPITYEGRTLVMTAGIKVYA